MKKAIFLIPLLFCFIHSVNADTIDFEKRIPFSSYFSESQLVSIIENNKHDLVNYWRDNLSTQYPYYYLSLDIIGGSSELRLHLFYTTSVSNLGTRYYSSYGNGVNVGVPQNTGALYQSIYCVSSSACQYPDVENYPPASSYQWLSYPVFSMTTSGGYYNPFAYYESNFDWYSTSSDTYVAVSGSNTLFSVSNGDMIPTYTNQFDVSQSFTEINLNNYYAVILSLKSYQNRPDFITPIYTLGQLCLTSVYDYGMKEKNTYYPDFKQQPCEGPYSVFSPVQISINSNALTYHSIWYVKPYNYAIENKIKVDPTIFDITYVSNNDANNPNVIINNRSYPVIPFSDLTDTANKSTDEGYVPGAVCNVGDTECLANSTGIDITNLFTHPLQLLQSVWASISSVFILITAFISLLPPVLQIFLFTSFMLAIILGIIKIIL